MKRTEPTPPTRPPQCYGGRKQPLLPSRSPLRRAKEGRLRRLEDWPERLAEAIEAANERPFSWGRHDCCLFACDAVMAMTGVDPAKPFRGKYKTKRGAFGVLKRFAALRQAQGGG